jgi:hypothetical protein
LRENAPVFCFPPKKPGKIFKRQKKQIKSLDYSSAQTLDDEDDRAGATTINSFPHRNTIVT